VGHESLLHIESQDFSELQWLGTPSFLLILLLVIIHLYACD